MKSIFFSLIILFNITYLFSQEINTINKNDIKDFKEIFKGYSSDVQIKVDSVVILEEIYLTYALKIKKLLKENKKKEAYLFYSKRPKSAYKILYELIKINSSNEINIQNKHKKLKEKSKKIIFDEVKPTFKNYSTYYFRNQAKNYLKVKNHKSAIDNIILALELSNKLSFSNNFKLFNQIINSGDARKYALEQNTKLNNDDVSAINENILTKTVAIKKASNELNIIEYANKKFADVRGVMFNKKEIHSVIMTSLKSAYNTKALALALKAEALSMNLTINYTEKDIELIDKVASESKKYAVKANKNANEDNNLALAVLSVVEINKKKAEGLKEIAEINKKKAEGLKEIAEKDLCININKKFINWFTEFKNKETSPQALNKLQEIVDYSELNTGVKFFSDKNKCVDKKEIRNIIKFFLSNLKQ